MAKLRDQFEDSFRYDASGTPRVWTPNDDIDGEFRRAKEEVSVMITRQVPMKYADMVSGHRRWT